MAIDPKIDKIEKPKFENPDFGPQNISMGIDAIFGITREPLERYISAPEDKFFFVLTRKLLMKFFF